jgi:hypothetical protein
MKTIIVNPHIHCQLLPDGRVEVLDLNPRFETTRRRVFQTAKNAAAKLRIDLKDALDCELEASESGEFKWKGKPFPLNAALKELEDAK